MKKFLIGILILGGLCTGVVGIQSLGTLETAYAGPGGRVVESHKPGHVVEKPNNRLNRLRSFFQGNRGRSSQVSSQENTSQSAVPEANSLVGKRTKDPHNEDQSGTSVPAVTEEGDSTGTRVESREGGPGDKPVNKLTPSDILIAQIEKNGASKRSPESYKPSEEYESDDPDRTYAFRTYLKNMMPPLVAGTVFFTLFGGFVAYIAGSQVTGEENPENW